MAFQWHRIAPTLALSVFVLGGCMRSPGGGVGAKSESAPAPIATTAAGAAAGAAKPVSRSALRRVISKASLELEVSSTGDALREATRVAEREGGFVASTSRQASADESGRSVGAVTLTLRVPADQFTAALTSLRRLGAGDGSEQITTEDVGEEFIDLDARIHNQKLLEAQFLEILKQASKVEDALNVQREIANVRTEVERMEGRRRFLERETAMSTITLVLTTAQPLVRASFGDFTRAVARASSDSVNLSAGIVTGGIRLLGVFLPLALMLGLPGALVLRALLRRSRRPLPAEAA